MSKDQLLDDSILIYPNPASNMINIELKEGILKAASVYDLHGRLLNHQIANSNMLTLTMNHLNAGIYLVRVQTQNRFAIKKIIKK